MVKQLLKDTSAILTRATALSIMQASAYLVQEGGYELEATDELTVEVVANRSNAQITALAAGSVYFYTTAYAFRKTRFSERVVAVNRLMIFVNKWLSKSIEEAEPLYDEFSELLRRAEMQQVPVEELEDLRVAFQRKADSHKALENLLDVAADLNNGTVNVPESRINYAVIQVQGSEWGTGLQDEMKKVVKDLKQLGKVSAADPQDLKVLRDFLLIPPTDVSGLRNAIATSSVAMRQMNFNMTNILNSTDEVFQRTGDFVEIRLPPEAAMGADELLMGQQLQRMAVEEIIEANRKNMEQILAKVDEAKIKASALAKTATPLPLRIANRILFIDTVVWGITGAFDLALNIWYEEDEQGFFSDKWGFSPIDEYIISPIWNYFFPPEEVEQYLAELFAGIENVEGYEAIVFTILGIYAENFNVDFSFDAKGGFPTSLIVEAFDPLYILALFAGAIIIREVGRTYLPLLASAIS